jgi:rubrerythrin
VIENLTLRQAVQFAVKTEELGATFYRRLATHFASDKELNQVFALLAKDEDTHQAQFKALLETVPAGEEALQYEQEQYLRAMATAEIFSGDSGLFKNVDAVESTADALEKALHLEKATLTYYLAMRDVLPESRVLDTIIASEKRHVVQVMRYLVTGAKMRGLSDTF